MLTILAALALSQAAGPAPRHSDDSCRPEQGCVRTGPRIFALADKLYEQGDAAGAAGVLEALTQDVHPELRAEARFRLAALREKWATSGRGAGASRPSAEQPDANPARLELARMLARMGKNEKRGGDRHRRASRATARG